MGFSVASLPGPMIVLVASETLRRGLGAGLIIMTAPLLVDALVILPLVLMIQASLIPGRDWVPLGFVGAALLVWLGLQSMRGRTQEPRSNDKPGWSLRRREMPSFLKGVLTHCTNPYPYIFWGTVGVVFVRQGIEQGGVSGGVVFPLGFWLGAGTLNLLVVTVSARGREMLPPQWEPHLHRILGILLIGSAILVGFKAWRGLF